MKIIFVLLLAFLFGCVNSSGERNSNSVGYISYRDIPGITEEEINAIEELKKQQNRPFVYGTLLSTESFYNNNGEMQGFTVQFCDWLTKMFGIKFEPRLYEWNDLLKGLENGKIDFTGELTATYERRKKYFMTDGIAQRLTGSFRVFGSQPLNFIASSRKLRYGFLYGTTTIDDVSAQLGNTFEAFFVDDYDGAYAMLKNGSIDAFIDENTAEVAFDIYGDVDVEDFFPLLYGQVSLSTQKAENKHIISAMQKILEHGGIRYLTELYNSGIYEYRKYKFIMHLTDDEKAYLQSHPVVEFLAEHDNYPVSFYNTYDNEFQGISHDVIKEVEDLTGISFKLKNDKHTDWADILKMLERGDASMVTELIRTPERTGRFLWAETAILTDNYALMSKAESRNIKVNDILYLKVGLVEGYAPTDVFNRWFPGHRNTVIFDNFDQAFAALTRGEVDLVMGSQNQLLVQTNVHGQPGYKANIVFNYSFESTFGFNKDEFLLRSIADKALRFINTVEIEDRWTSKTYDYRIKFQRQRSLVLSSAIVIFLCIIFVFHLSKAKRRLEKESKYKSEFMARMSHEIRTPINAIMGMTELSLRENLPSAAREHILTIKRAGANLLSIVNNILNFSKIESRHSIVKFIAPQARVLVVDDIATNLKVAEGLLKPYNIQVDLCESGQKAIDQITKEASRGNLYDFVFMDHMMPEMDGVEATKRIRELNFSLPIIALTANVIPGIKEMFLANGFSDFLSKPIDIAELNVLLKKWIPAEKQEKSSEEADNAGELSAKNALLSVFHKDGIKKIEEIKKTLETEDYRLYTVYVHALKSASANIGAVKISEQAQALEEASKQENLEFIKMHTPQFLADLQELLNDISANIKEKLEGMPSIEALTKLKEAIETFDIDAIDEASSGLQEFKQAEGILQSVLVGSYDEALSMIEELLNAANTP